MKRLIYLDNAATSQKPRVVINAILEYYRKTNANIHRGLHKLAEDATRAWAAAWACWMMVLPNDTFLRSVSSNPS